VKGLSHGIDEQISGLDGFIAATVHRSGEGERVVGYAQWRDADAPRRPLGTYKAARRRTLPAIRQEKTPTENG